MSTATERRHEAIQAFVNSVVTTDRETGVATWHTTDRIEVAAKLRDMQLLGRTARWRECCVSVADMVEDQDNPFDWAVLQGSIWLGHAAG